eukprot:3890221-Pyramimonas_sp.AAC.1
MEQHPVPELGPSEGEPLRARVEDEAGDRGCEDSRGGLLEHAGRDVQPGQLEEVAHAVARRSGPGAAEADAAGSDAVDQGDMKCIGDRQIYALRAGVLKHEETAAREAQYLLREGRLDLMEARAPPDSRVGAE